MWGWGEIISGLIAIFLLIAGIFYSKESHEKYSKNSGGGTTGTIMGDLFYAFLSNSPYYVPKVFLISLGIIILVCIFISKM
jgi:hypothetical protein